VSSWTARSTSDSRHKQSRGCAARRFTNKPPTEREMMPVIFPIHEAAAFGDVEQIKSLFKNSPNLVDSTDEKGLTPLHVAAANKQFKVAAALLALRAKVNARAVSGQTPLQSRCVTATWRLRDCSSPIAPWSTCVTTLTTRRCSSTRVFEQRNCGHSVSRGKPIRPNQLDVALLGSSSKS